LTSVHTIINSVRPHELKIQEEQVPTNGNLCVKGFSFTALANAVTPYTFSFPFDVSILTTRGHIGAEHAGNSVTMHLAADTTVGYLTSEVQPADSVVNVSMSAAQNIERGYWMRLVRPADGVALTEYQLVIAKDEEAATLTLEEPVGVSATFGTLVQLCVKPIEDLTFSAAGLYVVGDSKIGGMAVPKLTPITALYNNTTNENVVLAFQMDYLY
jgi:hypothetical protein